MSFFQKSPGSPPIIGDGRLRTPASMYRHSTGFVWLTAGPKQPGPVAPSVRLVCGCLVRLPRTDAPLTSGPLLPSQRSSAAGGRGPPPLSTQLGIVRFSGCSPTLRISLSTIQKVTRTHSTGHLEESISSFELSGGWEVMLRSTGAAKPAIGGAQSFLYYTKRTTALAPARKRGTEQLRNSSSAAHLFDTPPKLCIQSPFLALQRRFARKTSASAALPCARRPASPHTKKRQLPG